MPFTIPNEADVAITDLAEPDRVDIDILVEGIKRNGVVSGGTVSAQVTPDDTVAITAVTFEYNGRRYSIAGGNSPSMPANGASPMFYLVCATTGGTFSVVPGTAASQPSFPPLPGNAVVLAAVYRDAGVTTVQNNRIVDKRVRNAAGAARQDHAEWVGKYHDRHRYRNADRSGRRHDHDDDH
jgi:hypothetical protein